ncbi:MAG: amino acid racemase [Desulfurococcales archaeon]|nr:amino acid racemase [Desulfurococcales archaeon]
MKKIGIIGGLSPESTLLYYKYIIEEYRRRSRNEYYPIIIIYSVNFGRFADYMRSGKHEKAYYVLEEALQALENAGADIALIAANTPHVFYEQLKERARIGLISIIDALAERLLADGVERVGLLGTKYTLSHGFYRDALARYGIETIVPEPHEIELVNEIIFRELTRGVISEASREKLTGIVMRLVEKGAQGVALACTELPMILRGEVGGAKLYDTTRIHVLKVLDLAFQG